MRNTISRTCLLMSVISIGITVSGLAQDRTTEADAANDQSPLEISERLVVGTRNVPPFSMRSEQGPWTGISIDLLREVEAQLELESGHEIEIEFRDLPLSQLLDAVESGEIDMGAAAITVNYEREKRMDFSHAFHTSGLGIAVNTSQRRSNWSGVFDTIFSATFLRILSALVLTMLISAVAIYLFERRHNRDEFKSGWIQGVAAGMWWAAVTLTTVGYGDKVPRTIGGRLIALVWMFAGLFIIAGFTAAVTSAVTLTQLQSKVSDPSDLARVTVATVEGSTSTDYLRSRHIMYEEYKDVESALKRLAEEQCDAVVYDAPILQYYIHQEFSGEAFVLPVTFERQNYAFALPSGSPLREPVNRVLLRETSSPAWKDVLATYFGESQH